MTASQQNDIACKQSASIISIDIGYLHTSVCEWNPNNTKYKLYLFSVADNPNYQVRFKELKKQMDTIFSKVQLPIKYVVIEQQLPNTKNIQMQRAIEMYLTHKSEQLFESKKQDAEFIFYAQDPHLKYRELRKDHKNENMKVVGGEWLADNYIDKDLIEIAYNHNFGLGGSKRRADGTPRKARWYSDKTYEFVKKNDLDKLDDISDTVLIILAVRKQLGV